MSQNNVLCYTEDKRGIATERFRSLPSTNAEQVILFGGTFEPPHVGHLAMAQLALEQTSADEVWFLPAPRPPHKEDVGDDTFPWRVEMVDALIEGRAGLRSMPIESLLPRPSFSADTVRACQEWCPDVQFSFLIGADSLAQLPTWHRVTELASHVTFVVATRAGYPFAQTLVEVQKLIPGLRASLIEMPMLDVSSTWLRERMLAKLDVCGLVPPAVLDVWTKGRGFKR